MKKKNFFFSKIHFSKVLGKNSQKGGNGHIFFDVGINLKFEQNKLLLVSRNCTSLFSKNRILEALFTDKCTMFLQKHFSQVKKSICKLNLKENTFEKSTQPIW